MIAAATLIPVGIKVAAGVVLAALLFGAGHHYGAKSVRLEWNAERLERAQSTVAAIVNRTRENTVLAAKQDATNATITKAKHEELSPVRERIVTQRVYVGSAICGDGAAPTTEAESAAGGDGTDPARRLVREDVERDIAALKLAVEEHLATGRACQRFLDANDLVP